jgi:hypothetical protein
MPTNAKQKGPLMSPLIVAGVVAVALLVLMICVAGGTAAILLWRSMTPVDDPPRKRADEPARPVEQPPENLLLTDAHFKFSWATDGDRHILLFKHGQVSDLQNVRITIRWFYAGYKSGATQALNWDVWAPHETKQQVMAVRGRPTQIRIVGEAEGITKRTKYTIDCPIPDPPDADVGPKQPDRIRLTAADLRFSWRKENERYVLSFDHGQADDLKNVVISVQWYQSAYKSNASQRLAWPIWKANDTKEQKMAIREQPTAIRIVGQAEGPRGIAYQFDCAIPDPR